MKYTAKIIIETDVTDMAEESNLPIPVLEEDIKKELYDNIHMPFYLNKEDIKVAITY